MLAFSALHRAFVFQERHMKRREFISLVGGVAAAWPLAARAQQDNRVRRIGVLMPFDENDPDARIRVRVLRQELRRLGWTEGSNLHIEERWPADDIDRVRAHVA